MCARFSLSAYSMVEVLGAAGFVAIMLVMAIPSYLAMSKGGQRSEGLRNVSLLNEAVYRCDKDGQLTAELVVPGNVKLLPDTDLPEALAWRRLQEANYEDPWFNSRVPVFSDQGYRLVWVNGLKSSGGTARLEDVRLAAARWLKESGEGGRFEMVSPGSKKGAEFEGRRGIVGFRGGAFVPSSRSAYPEVRLNSSPTLRVEVSPVAGKDKLNELRFEVLSTDPDGDLLEYRFTYDGIASAWGDSASSSHNFVNDNSQAIIAVRDGRGGQSQVTISILRPPGAP